MAKGKKNQGGEPDSDPLVEQTSDDEESEEVSNREESEDEVTQNEREIV